jgi:hypothetical protein
MMMSALAISAIVFGCVFGGALAGIALRAWLPEPELSPDSKNAVTVAMGMVATLAALVLGLLVGSAKGSFDAQTSAVTNISAQLIMVDRVLSHYGPETEPIRADLRTWRRPHNPPRSAPFNRLRAVPKGCSMRSRPWYPRPASNMTCGPAHTT